ncbi:MAG: AAA family ATPase [Phycisphaerales bacterium]|nr:AAA family ATPase [Phycisphaerales bacterium]
MTTAATTTKSDLERFEELLGAGHACISIVTLEEEDALRVVRDAAMGRDMGNIHLWSMANGIEDGLLDDESCVPDTEHPAAALYHFVHQLNHPALCIALDLAPHLRDEKTRRLLRNCITAFRSRGSTLVMIDEDDKLPPAIQACTTRFEMSLPNEDQIERLIKQTLRRVNREHDIEIDISKRGFQTVIKNLRGLTRSQIERIITDVTISDRRFDEEDINHILAHKRQTLQAGGLLEYIETPIDLSEIGGLKRLKSWLNQRQGAMSQQAQQFGLSAPRGVLLLGVQGAGKSLCAKAVAAAWQRPLLRMDPGALYDRYIGESERRLRETLHQAEQMAPIILWIDEIEKGFASAAGRSSDGGLSRRMFGTLLTWMQDHEAPVFIIATANDIEALPPELLRKGRFDEIFFVDLPDESTRAIIFQIHLKKRGRSPEDFDLDALAHASDGFSGAEIEQAVIAGLHDAFSTNAALTTQHMLAAVNESPPLSVTMREKVDALRTWSQRRCVPAN